MTSYMLAVQGDLASVASEWHKLEPLGLQLSRWPS